MECSNFSLPMQYTAAYTSKLYVVKLWIWNLSWLLLCQL
jgi:hypothetical protein